MFTTDRLISKSKGQKKRKANQYDPNDSFEAASLDNDGFDGYERKKKGSTLPTSPRSLHHPELLKRFQLDLEDTIDTKEADN